MVDKNADEALVKISTLRRDVSFEDVRQLVGCVLESPDRRVWLPLLIVYMRNHAKSVGPGVGMGEKGTSIKLLCALFERDHAVAVSMLRNMVFYGSWGSLLHILAFTDYLGKVQLGDKYHPSNEYAYRELQEGVYALFASQLKSDDEAASNSQPVSNASKYVPHEGRGGFHKHHGDKIAEAIFIVQVDANDLHKRNGLRRQFRQLRSKLNEANGHFAEVFLSSDRAAELNPKCICAGTLQHHSAALLNLDKLLGTSSRCPHPGRALLRQRITKRFAKFAAPAPADALQLAEQLLSLHCDPLADEAQKLLLHATYRGAVLALRDGIQASARAARDAVLALELPAAARASALAAAAPQPPVLAVECGLRVPLLMGCLLAMIFADARRLGAFAAPPDPSAASPAAPADAAAVGTDIPVSVDAAAGAMAPVVLFWDRVALVPAAAADEAAEADPGRRLAQLLAAAAPLCHGGGVDAEGTASLSADYAGMLTATEREVDLAAGQQLVVCGEFGEPAAWAAAVRAWRAGGGVRAVSCWRLDGFGRARTRRPVWDAGQPRVDLVMCLDTTGSMGNCIDGCKAEAQKILRSLSARLPVRCAFVSYKDFGNPADPGGNQPEPYPHIAAYGFPWLSLGKCGVLKNAMVLHHKTRENFRRGGRWASVDRPEEMEGLQTFIAGLRPSGGGRAEDLAGGLEAAGRLFEMPGPGPAMRLCLVMADAPCHGLVKQPEMEEEHKEFEGCDQTERAKGVIRRLLVEAGVELLLCNPGGNMSTERMAEEMNQALLPVGSFVEEVQLGIRTMEVFHDKVLSALRACVASALAPAHEPLDLDVFTGTDFSVPLAMIRSRFQAQLEALGMSLEHKNLEDELALSSSPSSLSSPTAVPSPVAAASASLLPTSPPVRDNATTQASGDGNMRAAGGGKSTVELLLAKLQGDEYLLARATLATVREGLFAGLPWKGLRLADAAVTALARAGATPRMIREAGYPEELAGMLHDHLASRLAKAATNIPGKPVPAAPTPALPSVFLATPTSAATGPPTRTAEERSARTWRRQLYAARGKAGAGGQLLTLAVPFRTSKEGGRLIGKRGRLIREVEAATGARVQVVRSANLCLVAGDGPAASAAVKLMQARMKAKTHAARDGSDSDSD